MMVAVLCLSGLKRRALLPELILSLRYQAVGVDIQSIKQVRPFSFRHSIQGLRDQLYVPLLFSRHPRNGL